MGGGEGGVWSERTAHPLPKGEKERRFSDEKAKTRLWQEEARRRGPFQLVQDGTRKKRKRRGQKSPYGFGKETQFASVGGEEKGNGSNLQPKKEGEQRGGKFFRREGTRVLFGKGGKKRKAITLTLAREKEEGGGVMDPIMLTQGREKWVSTIWSLKGENKSGEGSSKT